MKAITIIIFLVSFSGFAQVDILDKNRKVLKTVQERDLQRIVDSIGSKARYTGRWIENKPIECRIQQIENLLI